MHLDFAPSAPGIAPPSTATPWARSLQTHDIDAHAAAQGTWSLHYEQLSAGRFCGALTLVDLEGLRLLNEHTNLALRQRGGLGAGAYGFALSLSAPADMYFHGRPVPANAIMCGRGHQIDMVTPTQHSMIALEVDKDLLITLWERMYHRPLAAWLEHPLVLSTTEVWSTALQQRHSLLMCQALEICASLQAPTSLSALRDDILIEWIEALPCGVDTSDLPTLQRRRRLVDKACELMLAHAEEPLSMLQVCSTVGASRRKLNYCFQDVLGIAPTKYLRAIRLNGVRRALQQAGPGTTVQDTAARWGFWHLGQFSSDYKKHCAQLPSQTLAEARRDWA